MKYPTSIKKHELRDWNYHSLFCKQAKISGACFRGNKLHFGISSINPLLKYNFKHDFAQAEKMAP